MPKINKEIVHQCRFCDKKYKKESTILTHSCIKRDRYNDRESRLMREAYRIYMLFMDINKLKIKKSEEPLFHFIKSRYFNDFYDFAEYILNNDILKKDDFIKNIITSGLTVYEWKSTKTLKNWILECIKNEHPRRGIERSIYALVEWSETTNNEWNTFFENASTERAILWLETGKISPWLIHIVPPSTCNKLLGRFSDSDLEYLYSYIDPTYFQRKQITYKNEIAEIRQYLVEAGL